MDNPAIPTALTSAESDVLRSISSGKYVLEAGALLGYSTVVMAQVAEQVISIDPHEGYPERAPKPTFGIYMNNLRKYGVRERVVTVIGRWQEALISGHKLYPYDTVFMDLTGRYEDTKEFLMYLHPEWGWRLKTIAVHDCGHPDWPGVDRAVREFREFLGMHARFEQTDRLGVFRYA